MDACVSRSLSLSLSAFSFQIRICEQQQPPGGGGFNSLHNTDTPGKKKKRNQKPKTNQQPKTNQKKKPKTKPPPPPKKKKATPSTQLRDQADCECRPSSFLSAPGGVRGRARGVVVGWWGVGGDPGVLLPPHSLPACCARSPPVRSVFARTRVCVRRAGSAMPLFYYSCY